MAPGNALDLPWKIERQPGWRWLFAALLLAVLASLVLAFAPLNTQETVSGESEPRPSATVEPDSAPIGAKVRTDRLSLVQSEGWRMAWILTIPVVVCLIPLLASARMRRPLAIGAAALLGPAIVVTGLSIGPYYLPSEILMIIAAFRVRAPARRNGHAEP